MDSQRPRWLVWLLLEPRDYLSTFVKLGTIATLAVGIIFAHPQLQMPSLTGFIDGTGPVFAGKLFPFAFVAIACGAISGFHSLISSGTTPKMLAHETDAWLVGYGAMLAESFVAIMVIIAACSMQPGVYFASSSPAGLVGSTPAAATTKISSWGYPVTPDEMHALERAVGEKTLFDRTGGAPAFAVGMTQIFLRTLGGPAQLNKLIFADRLNAGMTTFFIALVVHSIHRGRPAAARLKSRVMPMKLRSPGLLDQRVKARIHRFDRG